MSQKGTKTRGSKKETSMNDHGVFITFEDLKKYQLVESMLSTGKTAMIPHNADKKTKTRKGEVYFTKQQHANKYASRLYEELKKQGVNIALKHFETSKDEHGAEFLSKISYSDVKVMLSKYIEENQLIDGKYIKLDEFLLEILGKDHLDSIGKVSRDDGLKLEKGITTISNMAERIIKRDVPEKNEKARLNE